VSLAERIASAKDLRQGCAWQVQRAARSWRREDRWGGGKEVTMGKEWRPKARAVAVTSV
jgi:hypothetical protein